MPNTPPKLTAEQRSAALAKAAEARKARAHLKAELKAGRMDLSDVMALDDEGNEVVKKTKVSAVLAALPKIGPVRVADLMSELDIAPNRRIGGLGYAQRESLLAHFGFHPRNY